MVRRFRNVFLKAAATVLMLGICGPLGAEPVGAPAEDSAEAAEPASKPAAVEADDPGASDRRSEVMERWEDLPAPLKRRFKQNLERWENLPPGKRGEMIQRHRRMRRVVEAQVAQYLQEHNVELTEERRQELEGRYLAKRQALEQELLEQLREERRNRLPKIFEELKEEFPELEEKDRSPSATASEQAAPAGD